MIEASAGVISAGEPSPADEDILDAQEMAAIDEEKLEALGESLAGRRDEWVAARKASGVEKRWIEDLDQYHGRDASTKAAASMMDSAEQGYPVTNRDAKPQRSTVYVNITRPKTNAIEARLANMLYPSDDRNWGLQPSPAPELIKAALAEAKAEALKNVPAPAVPAAPSAPTTPQDPTQPAPPPVAPAPQGMIAGQQAPALTATQKLAEAAEKCTGMQEEMDDQLMACQFNGEGRKLLHNAAVLGTGILKGPIVVNRSRKAWSPMQGSKDTSVFVLEMVEEKAPASESVSPWNVFPDPSCDGDIHNGRGIFEYKTVTSKQMRDLIGQPGYLKAQIAKVLKEGPQDSQYQSEHDIRSKSENGTKSSDKDHYQLWEYWGEFSPEDMRMAGVDVADGSVESVSGCLIIVNQTVIKGFLNPAETGDIPYDFMQWELVDDSPWGYGVPFLMRPSQRVLNAAWRQLMDNSGLSSGPIFFIKKKGIRPSDGRWELTGRKIFECEEDVNPADACHSIDIPNHGQEIQQIIDLAMKFADEETSAPQLAQGEHGNAPDTVGGMTILMNSSNVVLSRMVKQYDDCITRPHLNRYYDWNMAYSDKANIKGDFQVDARGSSALLVRDLQAQSLLQLGQYQGSPLISPFVNWESWFKQVLKLQHIDPTDIMKTEAEIAQVQSAPPAPPIQIAIEQMKGQNAMQLQQAKAQAEIQMSQAEMQQEQVRLANGQATPHMATASAQIERERLRGQTALIVEQSRAHAEAARADKELEIAQQNGQFKLQEMQLQKDLAVLEYTAKHNITLEQAKVQLAQVSMQEQTKRQLAATEQQLAVNEGDKNRQVDLHKHTTSLVRDTMSNPNTP